MPLPNQIQKLIDILEQDNSEKYDVVKSPAKMRLGEMYLMAYQAKWKNVLPFWDALPLFVLLGKSGDRMLGVNLHYIPYALRVNVAKELMKMTSWKKRIQYKDIAAAWKAAKAPFGYLYLCLRTYLYSHIMSEIKNLSTLNYEPIIKEVMPKFKKETEENIYKILMSKFYKKAGGISKVKWKSK